MNEIPHTRLPGQPCPVCGCEIEALTVAGASCAPAVPGDYVVCLQCAAILRFDCDLKLHLVPDLAAEDVPDDTKFELRRVQQKIEGQKRDEQRKRETYDRDWWTEEAMLLQGGDFVHRLGLAARAADAENLGKIKKAFADYWRKYEEIGRQLSAK